MEKKQLWDYNHIGEWNHKDIFLTFDANSYVESVLEEIDNLQQKKVSDINPEMFVDLGLDHPNFKMKNNKTRIIIDTISPFDYFSSINALNSLGFTKEVDSDDPLPFFDNHGVSIYSLDQEIKASNHVSLVFGSRKWIQGKTRYPYLQLKTKYDLLDINPFSSDNIKEELERITTKIFKASDIEYIMPVAINNYVLCIIGMRDQLGEGKTLASVLDKWMYKVE